MLSKKLLRQDIELVVKVLKKRNFYFDVNEFKGLESARKQAQIATQNLQNLRNTQSGIIGMAKSRGEDVAILLAEVSNLGAELEAKKVELSAIQSKINAIIMVMPNMPHSSVPQGDSEADNVEITKWGEPTKFNFAIKDHVDLGVNLGLDFETATKIAGSRFVVMKGNITRLHRALIQFMLDKHIDNGYTEVYVPYLVNSESLLGTGQLPKFEADLFKTYLHDEAGAKPLYLIPTAEVSMTNIVRDVVVNANELPLKLVAHTPSFRSEAGSYGRDTRGLIRQHQFEKVELVQISKAEDSYRILEELTADAESILQALELPYQKVVLCTGDLGFAAAKTYDLEVWLPGQKAYREISSCSCFEDFQARRIRARWKNPATNNLELLHTLNGSGLAVGRTLVAIMENYQQVDGSIKIPKVLLSYMNGITIIK